MREIDKDGTGNINYREFVRFLEKPAASKPTTTASKPAMVVSDRVASELRTKFDAAISSGKIKSYEDVFKAMDRDGNGTVSRREFEDGMADLRVSIGPCGLSGLFVSRTGVEPCLRHAPSYARMPAIGKAVFRGHAIAAERDRPRRIGRDQLS